MKTRHQELTPGVAARRNLAARTAVASGTVSSKDPNAIRPFHLKVPEAELTELRRGINQSKFDFEYSENVQKPLSQHEFRDP